MLKVVKLRLNINFQYGIVPYVKQMVLHDVNNNPFTFKLDESTSSQVKKQYDAVITILVKKHDEVVNCDSGSLLCRKYCSTFP